MRLITKLQFKVSMIGLAIMLAVFAFADTAFAQTPPKPTPPPSGSNPQAYAPTDVPVDISLFWVLVFFGGLLVALVICNFLTRSKVLGDSIDQPTDTVPNAGFNGR